MPTLSWESEEPTPTRPSAAAMPTGSNYAEGTELSEARAGWAKAPAVVRYT